jgi:electron transfer flavoprotein alpha subunit
MGKDILIVAGAAQEPTASARELMTLARRLAEPAGARVGVLVCSEPEVAFQGWSASGADVVYRAQCPSLSELLPETELAVAAAAASRAAPALILLPHTVSGAELAPRLAFRLSGAAATGCVAIAYEGEWILCTRPCYGGLAREVDAFAVTPVVATVRAGILEQAPLQAGRDAEVIDLGLFTATDARTRRVARRLEEADGVRLEEARVVVAGGRGLEGPEGFALLAELAGELGGAVGASRVACDLGWCPHSWQIGLTGKTVTPELYIAVGISGAGHHMAGCGNAKAIVAINSDADAAIFQDSVLGVVGDYREVVPALTAALRDIRQSAGKA